MKTPYDKYISRLKQRRADNPEYAMMSRAIARTSLSNNVRTQESIDQMQRAGATPDQLARMENERLNAGMRGQESLYLNAQNARDTRIGQIDNNLDTALLNRENYVTAKKEEADAKKAALIQSGLSLGGTVLGGVGGMMLGGLPGAMLGAQIGGGIGGMAGSFAGAHSYGFNQFNPEQFDQGVKDTMAGVSSMLTNKGAQKVNTDYATFMTKNKSNLTVAQIDALNIAKSTSNIQELYRIMNEIQPGGYEYDWWTWGGKKPMVGE